MSGSITESEACASEFDESWTPQQGQLQENYNFQWEPPWKNLDITIRLANGTTSEHTSFLLVPTKMQFLMKHSLSKIHQIIHSTKCCQVDSINSSKEHLEIRVNSSAADEIFNEVENYLVNEVDEVLLKPIQRFPYTAKLAEEYFKKGLKERSIDMLCDDSKIYIVGHSEQKDYINKGIEEIKRVTVTKILKIDEKWKIEAIKAFAFIDKLTGTFPDILARIQPGHSSIFLQGKDVTIKKAENEMKKLLSDLFNQKIQLDPLVLQLLTCKQASEMLTCILDKDRIQVVWTIDKTQLCFFSKFIINVDVLKSVLHEHFLTAGFSNSSQQSSKFCLSTSFLEITKMNEDKLLVLETTISGINIAATKQIILELLHREKMFYTDSRNTRGVQTDEVSSEIQKISHEVKEIKRKSEGLELRCKKSEDRCNALEKELHSEKEKYKRFAYEKHVLEERNRDMNSETTKQLKELGDLCYVHKSKTESQQNEIDSLKTTNEKLTDNLKIVNDELTKEEEKYILKIPNTDVVVSIVAKLSTSTSVYLIESIQRIEKLKMQSGVDVLDEDSGAIKLVGDFRSISLAIDILLKWTNEASDVKSVTDKIGKNCQGKSYLPCSDKYMNSVILHTQNEDRNHESNTMRDLTSQNQSRYIITQDHHTTQNDSLCPTVTDQVQTTTTLDDFNVQNKNNSSVCQFSKYSPLSSALNCSTKTIDDPHTRTKTKTYHDQVATNKSSNQFNEITYKPEHLQPNDRNIGISNLKSDEYSPSVRPKEYNVEMHSNSETKVSSQRRVREIGDKCNNVPSASKGCQSPGQKMNPNVFTEFGNKIGIENQPDEPASLSQDSLNKINHFPDVNGDSLMMTTKEGIKVYVYQGNLCYLNVRAIVNSSNDYMKHSSGLFSVIAKAAGEKMINECQKYLADNTRLQQGKVCVTTAGGLKHYAKILHVCAPVWARRTNTESYIEGLMNVIHTAMIAGDDNKLRSVAIPAIGSGGLGGPRQICFSSFPRAVALYSSKFGKTTSLKEVHFVDRDLEVVTFMQTAFLLALDESHNGKDSKLMKIPQKIKETFLCYVGNETRCRKYQSSVLPNKVNVLLCDGLLFSVPRHKHGEKILVDEEDTGVVITIDKEQTGKSQSASLCLQKCGNDFHWCFDTMKKHKNKSYGEAYDTFGDKQLKFGHVICPVMPPLSDKAADKTSPAQQKFQTIFRQSCANLFKKADSCDVKHLAVPVLVDDFYDYNADWFLWLCTNSMMMELHIFANNRKKRNGITVHFATNKNENLYQICKASLSNPDRSVETGKPQPVGKEQTIV